MGPIAGAAAIAGLSAAGNAAGTMLSSAQSYKYTKKIMQNRHQWETSDLRRAGLNPILSAGGGGSGGPSISAPHPGQTDLAGSVGKLSAAKLAKEQVKNVATDTEKKQNESAESFARGDYWANMASSAAAQANIDNAAFDAFNKMSPAMRSIAAWSRIAKMAGAPDMINTAASAAKLAK